MALLLLLGALAIFASGMFCAGHLGLYELILEFFLIMAGVWSVGGRAEEEGEEETCDEDSGSTTALGWIYSTLMEFKERKVEQVLAGHAMSAAAQIILIGVVFGWIVTLGWLFVRDWHFVIAREIQETLLDVIIFVPLLGLIAMTLRSKYQQIRSGEFDDEDEDDWADDPRDPEYDPMAAMYRIQASTFRGSMGKFEILATSGFWLLFGTFAYIAGCLVGWFWPIEFLRNTGQWHL